MPTIAELAEQPNDWYLELGLIGTARESADVELAFADRSPVIPTKPFPGGWEERRHDTASFGNRRPQSSIRPPRLTMTDRIKDEIHDLLCGGVKYNEERVKFVEQYRLGQAGFATAITTALVPALGQSAPVVGVVVAVSLTAIGKVGLNAWCAEQKEQKAAYQAKLKRYEDGLAAYRRAMEQAPPGIDRRRPPGDVRRVNDW